MKKREKNDEVFSTRVLLGNAYSHKQSVGYDHSITRGASLRTIPYDTGKVKIGIYYEPKVNYCNPDQDWVQKAILGIETFHVVDTVILGTMFALCAYAVMGLITRSWYD